MSLNPVLVSIITTYYNSVILGDFVKKSMGCLLNQTYKNIEFICINDGSTDNTLEQLETFAKEDPRIKIYSKENQKYAQYSKAYGQERATGEYIFLFDHDDLIDTDLIEKCLDVFTKNPELDIVTPIIKTQFTDGKVKYISNLDTTIKSELDFLFRKINGKEAIALTVGKYDIHIRGLYRNYIFKSVSFTYTEPLLNADEIVERLIFENAKYIGSCDSIYTHFIHPDSSAKLPSIKKIDIVRTDILLREIFKEKKIYKSRKPIFEITAYKNFINAVKTLDFFKNNLSKVDYQQQLNRIKNAYELLDKKTVLAQYNGLSKIYNRILLSNFNLLLFYYKIKS